MINMDSDNEDDDNETLFGFMPSDMTMGWTRSEIVSLV